MHILFAIRQPTPAILPLAGVLFWDVCPAHCRAERASRQSTAPLTGLGPGFGAQASRGLREYEMCATSLDTPFSGSVAGECCECSQRHVERVIGLDSSIKKGRPAVVDTFLYLHHQQHHHRSTPQDKRSTSPQQPHSAQSLSRTHK